MENKKKKRYGIIAALLLLVLAAGVGTYAWLTHTESLENVFTIGKFEAPENKPDPVNPENPDPTKPNAGKAYLFETKWDPETEHKMVPGSSMDKNPNVGIKKGSDNAFVFIYVKNAVVKSDPTYAKTPCFDLGSNWKAVEGEVQKNGDGKCVSGLFMYAKGATSGPAVLGAKDATEDVYTGELFSTVMIPGAMTSEDVVAGEGVKPEVVVSAFIFGADQSDGATSAADNAIAQAKAWVNDSSNHLK